MRELSYGERAALAQHPMARRLLSLLEEKETNLCLSVDVTSSDELLSTVDELGPQLAVVKTHIDIVHDFTPELPRQLRRLADRHNFLIFEDRKFADIGNTVAHQYGDGIYRIVEWADLINAHILPGPGIIEGLRSVGLEKERGLLLLAEMSSKGSLATSDYSSKAIEWAENYQDFVMGFITQTVISENPGMIHMTPGVKLNQGGDALGQQYNSPGSVLGDVGSDIAIIGRGILQSEDRSEAAERYRQVCWEAYKAPCRAAL